MDIRQKISDDLNIPSSLIQQALDGSSSRIKKFTISKRNGGTRLIYQPDKRLKTIQYWLMRSVFDSLPTHSSAFAYRRGSSILSNAKRHIGSQYFVRMDFKNFFPSIKWSDLSPIIETWHKSANPPWTLSRDALRLIRCSCFLINESLPIGYPSSPIISNAVMFSFDNRMEECLSDTTKFGTVIYTRYADDMVISTDRRNVFNDIKSIVFDIVKDTASPRLAINEKKTRIGSRPSGTAVVTGLRICDDGHITIHRKQRDHIRLLLSLYAKGELEKHDETSLMGHLAYVRHVAPQFYSKLQSKYFSEIELLRSTCLY